MRPGSIVSPFGSQNVHIENNDVGLDFRLGGSAIFRGGLNVRNNGTGVRTADGAGVLWFISIPPNPSSITGNGTDVELSFGARATFDGVAIGSITCERNGADPWRFVYVNHLTRYVTAPTVTKRLLSVRT